MDIFICSNYNLIELNGDIYTKFVIVIGCTDMLELHVGKFVITGCHDGSCNIYNSI
jgi:hypothetical protein